MRGKTPTLKIALLGSFTVQKDEQDVDSFYTAKARALLAYLALEGATPLDRAYLAELFWPNMLDGSARGNLRHALSNIRKVIGDKAAMPSYLLVNRRTVQLNPDAVAAGIITVDAANFQAFYQRVGTNLQAADEAIALYRGPFFTAAPDIDSPEFDTWVRLQRERHHRQMTELLVKVNRQLVSNGDYKQAIVYAQKRVGHEPWSEEAHVQLMNALWRNGQRAAAMQQYEQCRRLLREELDVAPAAETVALYEAIRDNRDGFQTTTTATQASEEQTAVSTAPPEKKAATEKTITKHNIPPQLKTFVGRKRELGEIANRFSQPNCRQLTLIGPGGMGKTQLVLQYARQEVNNFADGVWFVSLTGIADGEQIPSTIADMLGVVMTPDQDPLTSLGHFLRERTLLLILDNFEHLLDAALLIPKLLNQAPRLSILVTSRERLNLQVETVFRLRGLNLPTLRALNEHAPSEESDAVALFVDCAQRADISFTLSEEARLAVLEICHLVDGMPLGIELAAVWTRLLSCAEILENLQRSIDLLTVSMPDIPVRHRCMRALIEESWQNLSLAAQQLFARASIFRGGCSWSALRAVADASMLQVAELVDSGFLRRESDGSYQIHELMRQFGAEKLSQSVERETAVSQRHAHYYLHYLQQMEADLIGSTQVTAWQNLSHAIENIRAAWQWALEHQAYTLLDVAAEGFFKYHYIRGLARDGAATFGRAAEKLAADATAPIALLVRIRNYLGAFLEPLGRGDECQTLLTQNLRLARENNLTNAVGWALLRLGNVVALNEVDRAKGMFEESRELFQQTSDKEGIIAALDGLWLFYAIRQIDRRPALLLAQEALKWARDLQAPLLIARSLERVGNTYRVMRQLERARLHVEQALVLAERLKNELLRADFLNTLGEIAFREGDYQRSLMLYDESVQLFERGGGKSYKALTASENRGRLAIYIEDWNKAILHLQETAVKSQLANNKFMLGRCHEGLAYVWLRLGEHERARQELRSAIRIKDVWNTTDTRIVLLETIIQLLLAEEAHEAAAELLVYKLHHYPPPNLFTTLDNDKAQEVLQLELGTARYQTIANEAPSNPLNKMINAVLSPKASNSSRIDAKHKSQI
ncbi:MAG: BTAD domain-containing putative transcriptional regulator [Chloroflexota bacterium]